MKYTENYNLKKPEDSDIFGTDDYNDNFDVVDEKMKELSDGKADLDEGRLPLEQFPKDVVYNKLIAEYTHSGNPEIHLESVDVDTNTFYCTGHGLSNGNIIWATLNEGVGGVYPPVVFPGNLPMQTSGYFVVNATSDSFQVSTTPGGAARDITANATMDLSKWHFEGLNGFYTVNVNLPDEYQKVKVEMKGKSLQHAYMYVLPDGLFYDNKWYRDNTIGYPRFEPHGSIWERYTVDIDYSGRLTISAIGSSIRYSTTSVNVIARNNHMIVRLQDSDISFDSVQFKFLTPANGYNIKIYSNEI